MLRREFISAAALGAASLGFGNFGKSGKSHVLSFSFDDGFKKSFLRVAEIHEEYDLKGCFNVIATGHMHHFKAIDEWILPELMGSLDDWNDLVARGHEVMPHTWEHLNLTKVPELKAKKNIDLCLDFFGEHLDGYRDNSAVYNFAYNASTSDLENHLLDRIAAIRTGGWLITKDKKVNEIPKEGNRHRLGCRMSFEPDNCDDWVEKEVNQFLESDGGWLIVNLHGLDEEGWAPVSTGYYDHLLKRLVNIQNLEILPVGEVINRIA